MRSVAGAGQEQWPVGLYGSPPGNRLPTVLSGPPKKSLDQGTAEFAKNRVRTIREVPCPAGSARSRRASGTVDPYRRYLRYGTFKGPSSLRSRVGVGTVRPTWLIRPAAKLRRATLHITCAWVGGVLYCMASRVWVVTDPSRWPTKHTKEGREGKCP